MKFGKIHHQFWTWARAHRLSDRVIVFAAYLLTNEHSNTAGLYKLGRLYVCEDLECSLDECTEVYDELETLEFIKYCPVTKYVFIQKYLKWNPPQNKKHGIFIAKTIENLPSQYSHYVVLKERLEKYKSRYFPNSLYNTLKYRVSNRVQEGYFEGSKSIGYSIPYGNSKSKSKSKRKEYWPSKNDGPLEKNPKKEKNPGSKTKGQNHLKLFEEFWDKYPLKVKKKNALKAYQKIRNIEKIHPEIIESIQLQKLEKEKLKQNDLFCPEWPHPTTWLNGERWEDEVLLDHDLQIERFKKNTEWQPPWSNDEVPFNLDPEEMRKLREEKQKSKKGGD